MTAKSSARDLLLDQVIAWFTRYGVVDTSMRTVAAGIGTSNRMLHYHFGARDDLLAAVIDRVCAAEETALQTMMAGCDDPVTAGLRYWQHAVRTARTFAPLFFELSAHAMYGKTYAEKLRSTLSSAWLSAFADGYSRVVNDQEAEVLAHLSLAVGRGLLFELALADDQGSAENAVAAFAEMTRRSLVSSTGLGRAEDPESSAGERRQEH